MAASGQTALHADLSRGRISVDVSHSLAAPEDMFGFAERINPKRSFLFVSKVLGRHVPVKPSVMSSMFDMLAAQIPVDLPGPVVVTGMAETAVGLGAGVHRRYRELTGRDDVVFICTTRHPLDRPVFCEFKEEHSHATDHTVHLPDEGRVRDLMLSARSIVMVDDEASTGKTFANLFASFPRPFADRIERKVLVTLTDWSRGAAHAALGGGVTTAAVLTGGYSWKAAEGLDPMPAVGSSPSHDGRRIAPLADRDWGRLGVVDHASADKVDAKPGLKTIVLGTGEHVWRPFLIAEGLERDGVDVVYSSVTRSPISVGHTIRSKFEFTDNYGGQFPNYLYNVDPGEYGRIILCVETPVVAVSAKLLSALGPRTEIVVDGTSV